MSPNARPKLAGLVGSQLGQTLVAGGRSPLVFGAAAVSVGALVIAIQTPGVSEFFGCRPLGPVGWLTAIDASAGATGAPVAVPLVTARVGDLIVERGARRETAVTALPAAADQSPARSAG